MYVIVLLGCSCYAQQTVFQHLTVDQGLSQNSVVSISQDDAGYMWFATQDGLNRYDGNTFTKVNRFFSDITRTNYSILGKCLRGPDHNLWIGSINGVTEIWNSTTGKFNSVSESLELSSLQPLTDSTWLVGSYNEGLFTYDVSNDVLTKLNSAASSIYSILVTNNDKVYLGTEKGILMYEPSRKLEQYFTTPRSSGISDIVQDGKGTIYFASYGEGVYVDKGNGPGLLQNVPQEINVQDLHIDLNGNLWIATYGSGVFRVSDEVKQFTREKGNNKSLGYNDILCIYESEDGILWFGTDGGGISYYDPESYKFNGLLDDALPEEIHVDVARSICMDQKENIWIGTSGFGLTQYNLRSGELKTYASEDKNNQSISGDRVVSLAVDFDNTLWVGTQENGLNLMQQSGIFQSVENLGAKTIWTMLPNEQGGMWIGTRNEGLILYEKGKGVQWKIDKESNPFLTSNNIRALASFGDNELYIGTESDGVLLLNTESEIIRPVSDKIMAREIKCLYIDENYLWIGTAKNGIGIWNRKEDIYMTITEKTGLPNNVVYGIMEDDKEQLWISTNKGICSFPKSAVIKSESAPLFNCYDKEDGLQGMEYNTGAYYKAKDGTLYFGGLKGVNWIDPKSISLSKEEIKPLITEFRVRNTPLAFDTMVHRKRIVNLKYNQDYFSIKYNGLNFRNQSQQKYAYRLLGLNENWTFADEVTVANFTNVPPDEYVFQVAMVDNQGAPGKQRASLAIFIKPAFWQTAWFMTLCGLCVALIAFAGYKFRVTQVRREHRKVMEINKKIAEVEMQALQAQMNPHFLFNSLNSVKSLVSRGENEKAVFYLTRYSKLVRQILNNSRKKFVRLNEELEALELYIQLEAMRFNGKLHYEINVGDDVSEDFLEVPSLILQPYVENAIWHGLRHKENGEWKLTVSVKRNEDFILMEVEDNGIGRRKAGEIRKMSALKKESLGMKINEDRINFLQEIYGKDAHVKIEDLPNDGGTRVVVQLPIPE